MKKIIESLTLGTSKVRLGAYLQEIDHFIGDMLCICMACMCCCRRSC
jgi:hypothetical protein